MTYEIGERVVITYREFDLKTDEFLGIRNEIGKVSRVWPNGRYISIRTGSGKLYVRDINSENVRKDLEKLAK